MSRIERIKQIALEDGYFDIIELPGRGVCGLRHFVYTTGLCYGLDETGYTGRYCFSDLREARDSLIQWTGLGDPSGDWIKHKGYIEYGNPRLTIQKKYMDTQVKPITIAVQSLNEGVLKIYGEGEYLGEKIPDRPPFNIADVPNPCIRITDGGINHDKLVWGFMCWWSEKSKFEEQFIERIITRETVPIPEEIPIYEPKKEANEG